MKHRVIKVDSKNCKELLVFVDRDEDVDFVRLLAWHEIKDSGPMIQVGRIDCEADNQMLVLERIVADFSQVSAKDFVESANF